MKRIPVQVPASKNPRLLNRLALSAKQHLRMLRHGLLLLLNWNTRKPWTYWKSTFPRLLAEKPCTVITPVRARVQSFPNKSNKSNKEKVTNSSTNGYSMKPSRFQGKQGCGGLFSLKGRGCTAFFVAYITQRTDTTKIASLTVSHPFAIRDQLSSTPRLMGTL